MELASGNVNDRPWGATLGALWRRHFTGRLIVTSGRDRISIAFRSGVIFAATSTIVGDADVGERAARSFAFEDGSFVIDDEPPSGLHRDVDTRAVIFTGARAVLTEARLAAQLRTLGCRFKLAAPDSELASYGIATSDPAIARLRRGCTIGEHDRHATRAIVYALACCGAVAIERVPEATPGLAAGSERMRTLTTPPILPSGAAAPEVTARMSSGDAPAGMSARSMDARAAASRGQTALDAHEFPVAIAALQNAVALDPGRATYRALLAWAEFCVAPDKEAIAETTRRALAGATSEDPVLPVYYLACVAKALGRDREALRLYQRVLHLDPDHAAAHTEVKDLLERGGKRGLFDRFRR